MLLLSLHGTASPPPPAPAPNPPLTPNAPIHPLTPPLPRAAHAGTQEALYCTARVAGAATHVLLEVKLTPGSPAAEATAKADRPNLAPLALDALAALLRQ